LLFILFDRYIKYFISKNSKLGEETALKELFFIGILIFSHRKPREIIGTFIDFEQNSLSFRFILNVKIKNKNKKIKTILTNKNINNGF